MNIITINNKTALFVKACLILLISSVYANGQEVWYKGNTHAHTVLCGHADSSPDAVAKWYYDHGYNFLVLSEHNIFIDPSTVNLPKKGREDFILIPGEEITGHNHVHSTAVNIPKLIDWTYENESVSAIIQNHLDNIKALGGEHILNHPTYRYSVTAEDMKQVKGLHLFELHNGHPNTVRHTHEVDEGYVTTEDMWDDMLTFGLVVYGVSSDDTHTLKEWESDASNPGRGWVMVRSDELTPESITKEMRAGNFYATNGVILSRVDISKEKYSVEVDRDATLEELNSPYLMGRKLPEATGGFAIEFIGPEGNTVKHVHGTKGTLSLQPDNAYIRCRVSYTRRTTHGFEQFFAWTQPAFSDDRLARVQTEDREYFGK